MSTTSKTVLLPVQQVLSDAATLRDVAIILQDAAERAAKGTVDPTIDVRAIESAADLLWAIVNRDRLAELKTFDACGTDGVVSPLKGPNHWDLQGGVNFHLHLDPVTGLTAYIFTEEAKEPGEASTFWSWAWNPTTLTWDPVPTSASEFDQVTAARLWIECGRPAKPEGESFRMDDLEALHWLLHDATTEEIQAMASGYRAKRFV